MTSTENNLFKENPSGRRKHGMLENKEKGSVAGAQKVRYGVRVEEQWVKGKSCWALEVVVRI